MNRLPRGGLDLSFLSPEEARQIFHVLERDAHLKRAEKERVSKLNKQKEDPAELPRVTGQWFEEIQKRKFQNDTDVSKMFKQPLTHKLRKGIGNDSPSTKPSSHSKHASASPASILGGLRTPFASLFSSFRKSKRQQHPKPQQKVQECNSRYDHFATDAHSFSKSEKMAKTNTGNSSLPSEPITKCFDANQAETVEDNTCTWNEQLEKELLRVLGSLDDELAREQSQEVTNKRTPVHYDSKATELKHYPTFTPHSVHGEVQKNDQGMFFSDGTRTLRAQDECRTFSRPRVFYDTYMKRHHSAGYVYGDTYERSPVLRRGYSSRSLGHSSGGSLQLQSGPYNSGFGHTTFRVKDAGNRSCSLSCLARGQSLASIDQLSNATLCSPLENNKGITQRNYYQQTKRTPLSSIVWNTPQSSENSYKDQLIRTRSLMEFGPTYEDTQPYSPQENTSYDFYRSKANYRRAMPNATHSIFPDQHVDPLYLDNRENYLLHQMERSNMKYPYRSPLFRHRANMPHKSFPSGRTEEQFFRPNSQQYYSNEVFLASDADIERIPSNLNNWPNAYTEESYLPTWEHDNTWGIDYSEGVRDRLFSKYPDGIQRHTAYGQANHAMQQNLLAGAGQSPSESFVNTFQTNTNFQTHSSEEMSIPDCNLPDRMENESFRGKVRLVPEQRDINSATETHMSPMKSSSVALQHSLRKPTKLTSVRNIENMYLSNIHKREGPRNQDNFAVNRSLNQMNPFYLTAKSTRAMNQNLQQERHQSETLGSFVCNKTNKNTCSPVFSKGPEAFPHDRLSDSCTENIYKHDRFVKHVTSNSITGSPSNSPPKSPTTDYILPRKSSSIDGSVLSEKPVSQFHPTRQNPYRNKINVEDDLEALRSNKIENMYSHKKDKTTLLSPVHSSLCSSSKDTTHNEVPENKEYHLQLTQDSKHSFDDNIVFNKLEKQILCDPDKSEISVSSECEETDSRNPLKQYKTTSTLTVSIEEDNVKYHELISVYYTLPRKCSRTLFNLFLDDAKKDAGSVSPTRKSLPQQSNLATVTFPSSSEKENKNDSLCKVAAASGVQHNSKLIGNAKEEGTLILNTTMENAATSLVQSKMHNKDEAVVSSTEEPEFLISNRTASLGLLSDPKPSKTMDDSLSTLTNTLSNQHIDRYPLKKGSKKDKPLTSKLSDSTDNKTSSGTLCIAPFFAMDTQKRSLLPCLPSTEPAANNTSPILPSHLVDSNKEGKNIAGSEINITKNYMKYNINQETEVKEKYHNNSQKADELQINKNVRSGRQEALTSETKVCSDFQKQNPLVDVAFTANSIFPPNKSVSEYRKPAQECKPQNSVTSKVCETSQRSVKNSTDDQNPNSKYQLVNTTQDLSDNSASENKLMPHCTKDKTSDIEKRKNRLSIKNKLAAIYKTSRKFSSKKSLTPKPHISNIFSQNDAPFSEASSSDVPQLCLQTESENQNQNPLTNEFDHTALNKPDNKKLQTNEGSSLITNEIRRPFANLCNQKHGSPSPEQSDKKTGDKQNSTALFSKEIMPKLTSKGLENNNQLTSRIKDAHRNQKLESDSKVGDPVGSDKNSNIRIANYSNAASRPSQEVISPTEADHYQHTKHSDRLRNPNISCVEPVLNPSKVARERHFSENSYTQVLHDPLASGGNIMHSGSRYKRMFKSQSELLSCDENETWGAHDDYNRTLGSRRVMYPSIEFGIFGKEQQQAFLDNIKRSLTEGRLWRPSFLNSHHSLRKGEVISLSRSEQLTSGFAERKVSVEGTSPQIHTEAQGDYSESDSDTTTDDEYYLNENDKESEL